MTRFTKYLITILVIFLVYSTGASADADVTLTYSGYIENSGVTTFVDYAELGYDIYGVVDPGASFGTSSNTSANRRFNRPPFVDSIALNANFVHWGYDGYPLAIVPGEGLRRVGVLANERLESQGGLGQWRTLLNFTVNGFASDFRIGVVLPSYGNFDHVNALRFTSLLDGTSVTATIPEVSLDHGDRILNCCCEEG